MTFIKANYFLIPGRSVEGLLQLDNISDGFGNERRFEFLFNSRVIGFVKLSDLVGDPDNKREGPFKKKDNGS